MIFRILFSQWPMRYNYKPIGGWGLRLHRRSVLVYGWTAVLASITEVLTSICICIDIVVCPIPSYILPLHSRFQNAWMPSSSSKDPNPRSSRPLWSPLQLPLYLPHLPHLSLKPIRSLQFRHQVDILLLRVLGARLGIDNLLPGIVLVFLLYVGRSHQYERLFPDVFIAAIGCWSMNGGGRSTNLKCKATRLHRLAEVFPRSCLVEAIELE